MSVHNNLTLLLEEDVYKRQLYDYDPFGNIVKTTLKLAENPTPANSLVTEYAYARRQLSLIHISDFPDEFPFKVSDVELFKIGRTGKEVAQDGAPFMGMGLSLIHI